MQSEKTITPPVKIFVLLRNDDDFAQGALEFIDTDTKRFQQGEQYVEYVEVSIARQWVIECTAAALKTLAEITRAGGGVFPDGGNNTAG